MKKLLLACGSAASLLLLASFAFAPRPTSGPGAIEDMLRGMFQAMDRGDHAAAKRCLATGDTPFPVLVWDLDLENKPVAVQGAAAAAKYLDDLLDGAAKAKAKIATNLVAVHADCHSPELGYATIEFDQTVVVDGKSDSSHFRATVLVSMDKGGQWHVFHWHASLVPPAAQAGKSAAK